MLTKINSDLEVIGQLLVANVTKTAPTKPKDAGKMKIQKKVVTPAAEVNPVQIKLEEPTQENTVKEESTEMLQP